jgi:hypothetical protein
MGTNTLTTGLKGPNNIKFKDGHHIRFSMIDFKIGGTVMGDRTIETNGSVLFEDVTNNRKAVILMNTHKSSGFFSKKETGSKDEINGIIYDCAPIVSNDKSMKLNYGKEAKQFSDLKELKDVKK